jgi:hypothetical protein
MAEPTRNEGVIIGGNAAVSGPVAAGFNARAEQHNTGPQAAVARELAALRELIRHHQGELAEPDWVTSDVNEVEQEQAKPRPDRDRILAALTRLAGRVSAVTAVAAGVEKLREVTSQLGS